MNVEARKIVTGIVPAGLKRLAKNSRFYARQQEAVLDAWIAQGRTGPPPPKYKQDTLRDYGHRFGCSTLVETGTAAGDTVFALKDDFDQIFSVELSQELHLNARRRLSRWSHVHLLHGDSSRVLAGLLRELTSPTLFWLDAHYSAGPTARGDLDTPIVAELRAILENCPVPFVVLIDDARHFDGTADYPTVQEVRSLVLSQRPGWACEVEHDLFRIHEPSTSA